MPLASLPSRNAIYVLPKNQHNQRDNSKEGIMQTFNEINDKYQDIIDLRKVYTQTITRALAGQEYVLPDITTNQFFLGKLFHPNDRGHIQIAELLNDLYTKKYTRY